MIGKVLSFIVRPKKKVLKQPYSEWKYPIKQQRDLKASFPKLVKNKKWRAKTKLVEYSKKFI
jgi:hypothetical protein